MCTHTHVHMHTLTHTHALSSNRWKLNLPMIICRYMCERVYILNKNIFVWSRIYLYTFMDGYMCIHMCIHFQKNMSICISIINGSMLVRFFGLLMIVCLCNCACASNPECLCESTCFVCLCPCDMYADICIYIHIYYTHQHNAHVNIDTRAHIHTWNTHAYINMHTPACEH